MDAKAWLGALALVVGAISAHAETGLPSGEQLAAMGLGGMEILSDAEAETICVSGRPPNRWGNLYPFVKGVSRLEPLAPESPPFVLRYW